ncbi:hypothetical protein D9758_015598 [Tetrapyrgos nigripes]|uniref:Endonuclease/exonuclease/phosphatase domain-containing protein n=1 Tax=Tetrapyrgos nigripes TaxID=182062 RepID=A0A8H5FK21_9AGAR|nr:hypothetical protein D9758_015598 [Tetrapyrgos nigripes]
MLVALALPSPQTQPGQPSSFSNSQNSQSNTTTAAAPLISNVPLADAQAPALPLNFTQVASSPQCEAICFPWASMTMIAQAGLVATNVTCSPTMVDTLQKCVQCGFDWVPGLSGPTAQGCLDKKDGPDVQWRYELEGSRDLFMDEFGHHLAVVDDRKTGLTLITSEYVLYGVGDDDDLLQTAIPTTSNYASSHVHIPPPVTSVPAHIFTLNSNPADLTTPVNYPTNTATSSPTSLPNAVTTIPIHSGIPSSTSQPDISPTFNMIPTSTLNHSSISRSFLIKCWNIHGNLPLGLTHPPFQETHLVPGQEEFLILPEDYYCLAISRTPDVKTMKSFGGVAAIYHSSLNVSLLPHLSSPDIMVLNVDNKFTLVNCYLLPEPSPWRHFTDIHPLQKLCETLPALVASGLPTILGGDLNGRTATLWGAGTYWEREFRL